MTRTPPVPVSSPAGALYRTVWRWHFYAGLIVAPVLLVLAITGSLYLFGQQINDAVMPRLQFVTPVEKSLPPSALIIAALEAQPGVPRSITMPAAANRPAKVTIAPATGALLSVMVDPGSGRVLGSYVEDRTLVGFAQLMHGSLTMGWIGDRIVELAACWALVLIGTGVFLWWPRERKSLAGVLWLRLSGRGRIFWRDLHAVTGIWAMVLIAFMILTGLPWAGVQGPLVRTVVAQLGIGNKTQLPGYVRPESRAPEATLRQAMGDRTPWSQETQPLPKSDPAHAHHEMPAAPNSPDYDAIVNIDAIAARAVALGLARDFSIALPSGPTGVYTASNYPGRPQNQRTYNFDRWTGQLIGENGWHQIGVGARAIELGVQIHMGRYFGLANQLLMLLPCLTIIMLVVSGVIMWWRRRPSGSFGAPPPLEGARLRGAMTLIVLAGLLMPLFGASVLVLAILDRIVAVIPWPQRA